MESTKADSAAYRGKHFTIPPFSKRGGLRFHGDAKSNLVAIDRTHPVIATLNQPFDLAHFKQARQPLSLGVLAPEEIAILANPQPGVPRTLDLPIKFPGSDYRIPRALRPYASIIKRAADFEAAINGKCLDEYYCYLTVDCGWVEPGILQREAPCHVDGFQGARWRPKVRGNHSYTVSNAVPTAYYVQPFDFDLLDDERHNFFWEMNRQVALTNSQFEWLPGNGEMTLMDCYCVHRGTPAPVRIFRTFVRISFEARIFDRLGNAHNPLFAYDWPMVKRDIEDLNLVAFDETSDPSLRVFPHQQVDGTPHEGRRKTQPNLRPSGSGESAS
jgi:hypothetical protein